MRRRYRTFIGVDLGGGKGKTTAVARLRLREGVGAGGAPEVVVDDGGGDGPWYDDRLIAYLLRHAEEAVVAIDAPLTLPACVRCQLPACPGAARCEVEPLRYLRGRRQASGEGGKPPYTAYTQRLTEVLLHEEHGILPRETLGQGMGPLTARAAYLRRALSGSYQLNENLLEVYPKATLARLFPDVAEAAPPPPPPPQGIIYKDGNGQPQRLDGGAAEPPPPDRRGQGHVPSKIARHYKRSGHALPIRERILHALPDLRFGPGQWREFALQNDHQLDAVLCGYTAFLWARDGWELPAAPPFLGEDGWIWFPPKI